MSHIPQEFHNEFPQEAAVLQELKKSDAHFQQVAGRFEDVNVEIRRIETEEVPRSDQYLEDLKKQRLALLDEVAGIVARAKAETPAS